MNTSGNKQLSLVNTVSKSLKKNNLSLKLSGNSQWNQMPFFNGTQKDLSRSFSTYQLLGLSAVPIKWLDLDVGLQYEYTRRESKQMPAIDNSLWSVDIKSALYLPKDFRISFNITQRLIEGFGADLQKPFIINGTAEKRVFKRKNGMIGIMLVDMLKQNISPVRQYTTLGYQDRITNRKSRFVQLQFLWEPQIWTASKYKTEVRKGDGAFK
ncbi:outer membrane beta-barrel protein [Sphingobacterium paucimobilis]|uniref:Outer membrane protein beta-barrel domain-containing protein n=1 Tax=Sphingobacterium paucimobilis HER1398 TaxID=1346330 RepID=U2HX88_9SPHI|nr:outer membrane beta-barrel protein [Sphingobacterium paucimobilis]ERJ60152.1 hypothetical protein M472_15420 [Sphingobacterium paucimobilis HER1398]